MTDLKTPINSIDYHFSSYLERHKNEMQKHMSGNGLPDYAYPLDYEYRKKLDSIPGLFDAAKKITATHASRSIAEYNLMGIAVGPNQFPEVYQIGCDCARRLGISVPNIYILGSEEFNAWTIASDDVEPVIVITNLMLQRMPLDELRCVIAHECGHINNFHSVYTMLANIVTTAATEAGSMVSRLLGTALSYGALLTLDMWSRAAEVTADRAALLCCNDVQDAYKVNMKLMYGAAKVDNTINTNMDIEQLKEQLQQVENTPYRFTEILYDHPMSVKRIFAQMEFAKCDTFFDWRPDLKTPDTRIITKSEADEKCKSIIDIKMKGAKK